MRIKRYSLLIIIFFIVISLSPIVSAEGHVLKNLEMDVFINQDGSAFIREKREVNLIEGTENYIVIENIGTSKITNFKVTEDGKKYEFIDSWDIDESREGKTFKNGIIKTNNGYELAWGIGEYGKHEYILEYKVTNFIKGLQDNQMLLWTLVSDQTNTPPENVIVSIRSDKPFNEEDQKVWGFGFEGNVEFNDNMVIAKSTESLTKSNHVTILLKFDKGMFVADDYIDKSFEEIKEEAFEGSNYGGGSFNNPNKPSLIDIILPFISVMFPFVIAIAILIFKTVSKDQYGSFKRRYKEEYYRDYPYEGDILDIYYILYKMGLADFENMLTGFLLKWINEDKITTISEEKGTIIKRKMTNIKFLDKRLPEEQREAELFNMLISASEGKKVLEQKAFTKWISKNLKLLDSWEKKLKSMSIEKLEFLGHLEIEEEKKIFITRTKHYLTKTGFDIEEKIYKYINYLYDYSLLNEHEAINVKIWDIIMIWAGFLGITHTVSKQFEKLYPNYRKESAYRGNSIYLASSLTRSVTSARSSSGSSGVGGGTSVGGGGGSFGGGGGGTR